MPDPVVDALVRRATPRPPAWAIAVSAAILGSAIMPAMPLRDLVTDGPAVSAELSRPTSYVVFAPASNLLDALTLLSLPQHLAVGATVIGMFAVWRIKRARRAGRNHGDARRSGWRAEVRAALLGLGAVVAVYGAMAAAPRPMAGLRLDDTSLVAVDFHSHTDASHDARPGFTADENRSWHRAAGYGAAYISDHHSFRGVDVALATNPAMAGDTTMLLPALEATYQDQHVIVLGSAHDAGTAPVRQWVEDRATVGEDAGLILTIPSTIAHFEHPGAQTPARVLGIEISDGGPQGLAAGDRKRATILVLADRLDAALVTGSDNHGWGRTAAAWSVMTLPGWRGMSADSLDARIRDVLERDGRRGVRPIGRTRAVGNNVPAVLATVPVAAWTMLRTLSWPERLSWIAWCWMAVALTHALDSWRRRRLTRRPPAPHAG